MSRREYFVSLFEFRRGFGPLDYGLNSWAVQVMAEAGVDISRHTSKATEAVQDVSFDYVIPVWGHSPETCPLWLGGKAKVTQVGFDDPSALAKTARTEEEAMGHYWRVRDQIAALSAPSPKR